MGTGKQYDEEFKKQAIKLAKEVGTKAAADELCIPKGTLGTWVQKARIGEIDTGAGSRTPGESLTIAQQLQAANKRIKELEKKNRELEELNEFLEETSARLWRLQDKHFTIISAIKTPPGSIRHLQMK